MPGKQPIAKPPKGYYPLHQCALFKVGSKRRLADILFVDLGSLKMLAQDEGNFSVFKIPNKVCQFTGKVTKERWVQNPLNDLKKVHRRILSLLSKVIVPEFCHGGLKHKSYRSNAEVHKNAAAVGTFDLRSFFPSTSLAQVFHFFRVYLRCAPDVADILANICTYKGALATGSPVSPLLAYWANRSLFEKINQRAIEQNLQLSIYIDDLTFSGARLPLNLTKQIGGIVKLYGHSLSMHKTRRFGSGVPKHVTGVILHCGKLRVPYSRFRKARAIQDAIAKASDDATRESLAAKLGGLLGEASFIDPSYKPWALRAYAQLSRIKARRNATSPPLP